jgi:tetratricopeptide (TPR) repeat protein
VALELLDAVFAEHPDPSQLAAAWHLRATCLVDLGEPTAALEAFRESFDAMRSKPNWRTPAHSDFAELALALDRKDLYSEVIAVLDEFGADDIFPLHRFKQATARALIAADTDDLQAAKGYAQEALQAANATDSPFRYHRKLGLVQFVDPSTIARLRALAA